MTWRNPAWTDEKKAWFMGLIEGMVSKPEAANFATKYGRFDLEILLMVASEDEHVFDDATLKKLVAKVAKATGVLKPVIYLHDKPSREVEDLIRSKDMEL